MHDYITVGFELYLFVQYTKAKFYVVSIDFFFQRKQIVVQNSDTSSEIFTSARAI